MNITKMKMKKLCLLCLLTGTAHGAVIYSETFGTWSNYTALPSGWTRTGTFAKGKYNQDGYTGANPNLGVGEDAHVFLGADSTPGGVTMLGTVGTLAANSDYSLSLYLGGMRNGIGGASNDGIYTISLMNLTANTVLSTLTQLQSGITADQVQLFTLPTYSHLNTVTGNNLGIKVDFTGRFGIVDEIKLSSVVAVPETSSLLLSSLGVIGLLRRRR